MPFLTCSLMKIDFFVKKSSMQFYFMCHTYFRSLIISATSLAESPTFLARASTSFQFQGADFSIRASKCLMETFPSTRSNKRGPGTRRGGASSSEAIPFAFQWPPGIREGRIHTGTTCYGIVNGESSVLSGASFPYADGMHDISRKKASLTFPFSTVFVWVGRHPSEPGNCLPPA